MSDEANEATQESVYEYLLSRGVKEPAVLVFPAVNVPGAEKPALYVAGRWEEVSEVRPPDVGYPRPGLGRLFRPRSRSRVPGWGWGSGPRVVCRVGKVGVVVLGEGASWDEVRERVQERLDWTTSGTADGEKPATPEKPGSEPAPTVEKTEG